MGAERRSSYVEERVKRITAYHEGGHALAALYTDGAMPLHKVTCMPRGHALGIVRLEHHLLPTNTCLTIVMLDRHPNYQKTID